MTSKATLSPFSLGNSRHDDVQEYAMLTPQIYSRQVCPSIRCSNSLEIFQNSAVLVGWWSAVGGCLSMVVCLMSDYKYKVLVASWYQVSINGLCCHWARSEGAVSKVQVGSTKGCRLSSIIFLDTFNFQLSTLSKIMMNKISTLASN